jgi:hypothetical protein
VRARLFFSPRSLSLFLSRFNISGASFQSCQNAAPVQIFKKRLSKGVYLNIYIYISNTCASVSRIRKLIILSCASTRGERRDDLTVCGGTEFN